MDDESFEFVPKNWLMAWLADPLSVGPVETKHYLCVHENLDIDRLNDMKLCDSTGVNMLISEYGEGEGPRLNGVNWKLKFSFWWYHCINWSVGLLYIFIDSFIYWFIHKLLDSFVGWLGGWFLVGFRLVFGWLVAVLRIQLILMRIRNLDPHRKKMDPDPDPGCYFRKANCSNFCLIVSLIFKLKLDEPFRIQEIFIIFLFSIVQIWG